MSGTDVANTAVAEVEKTAEAAPAEGGLFALAEAPAEGAANGGEREAGAAASQPGERPPWLQEQFWDPEKKAPRVEAMAKALSDLRARAARAASPPETPDAYRLPEVEGLPKDAVKPDDPLWAAVRKAAHEAGVSQAQLEAIARPYLAEAARRQAEAGESKAAQEAAYAAEVARLGPQGRRVLGEVKAWVDGLVARGMLTADERAALFGVSTAEGVRALAKLRSMAGEKPIPVEAIEDGRMSAADARRLMDEAVAKGDASLGERAAKALRELAARGALA